MGEFARSTETGIKFFERRFIYSLIPSLLAASIMVAVKWTEWLSGNSFSFLGLRPRELNGLAGILFFPFLHADGAHLASNLFPFILFSTLIYNLVPRIFWKVFGFSFVLSGFWTWCFARPGMVIGASGWVYALLGFLLIAGFARLGRKTMIIAGGLAFLYGGMVYGLVPIQQHVSWEGHLMGFLAGTLGAFYWRADLKSIAEEPRKPSAEFEKDPPYPYWMYPVPHVIDASKNVIPPHLLVWENGKPRVKTQEELEAESRSSLPDPPRSNGFSDGYWTYHIS